MLDLCFPKQVNDDEDKANANPKAKSKAKGKAKSKSKQEAITINPLVLNEAVNIKEEEVVAKKYGAFKNEFLKSWEKDVNQKHRFQLVPDLVNVKINNVPYVLGAGLLNQINSK